MDLQHAVAISTLPGISRVRAASAYKQLREQAGADAVSLEDVIAACRPDADVPGVSVAALGEAERLLNAAATKGITAVPWWSGEYPGLLGAIPDPPPVLWVRGCPGGLPRPAVAIVGSRAATSYAQEVAFRLGRELAERGIVVVSGLARGADGAAHRGCLDAAGVTVAVLGSGPDIIYPAEHEKLAVTICEDGCLVSELGPGAPPLPEHFPLRNRLISGICIGVVVVEASENSGSLITARCALEQGRDVMAVPGSVLSGRNRGSHALLKDGAKVVETADDILEGLGWPAAAESAKISGKPLITDDLLSKLAPGEAYDVDEMSATVGLTGPELLPRLTGWEMRGWIVRVSGGRYRLADRN